MQDRRAIRSWILYDWANSVFATTVMAGFFPVLFKEFWAKGADPTESTWYLGLANSLSSAVVIFTAPVLGALADAGNSRRRYLFIFTLLACLFTLQLAYTREGEWLSAAVAYGAAAAGFNIACAIYDSLLKNVADDSNADRLSAAGYAAGYLGGGLLFTINLLMFKKPEWFGISSGLDGALLSFVTVAIWWAIFSIPLFLYVKEDSDPVDKQSGIREACMQVWRLMLTLRQDKTLGYFLLAYWLYIDGVYSVVKMAIDYGVAIGFASSDLILALLLTQFVGAPAAVIYGRLGERFGAGPAIFGGLAVYVFIVLWGANMTHPWEFYLLAVLIGLVQGGVQSLSRSFFLRLIPPNQSAEYFGFFNLVGKFSAVFGPLLVGAVSIVSGSNRLGMASLILLFALGAWVLRKVEVPSNS